MATYAIGDIHGCWKALATLLDQVPIKPEDTLITLGDYIDRGPSSARVLGWLIDRHQQGNCIALRGNHEVMLQASVEGNMNVDHWLACGGRETLESYLPSKQKRKPSLADVSPEHLLFLKKKLRPYHETDSHIFVHAAVLHGHSLEDQDEYTLYWERFQDIAPHQSGKTVICGHTAQKSGIPANNGHAICIDTWVYGRGWLTCLEVETGRYWQANQNKKHRSDWLDT